jgi:transposase
MSKLTRLLDGDPQARVVRSTVSRRNDKWVVSFTIERSEKQRRARQPDAVAGVDLGVRWLATTSTGERYPNGRPLEVALRRLRKLQRQLERQRRRATSKEGGRRSSARMTRTEQRLRRVHERVANLRREQAHELTTTLTREFGVIAVETLAVKNMMRERRLARTIADAGWAEIVRQLTYKTKWSAGSVLVAADRFYPSSKTCHACGCVKAKLGRGETAFRCDQPGCGWIGDRDLNAALNLAGLALETLRAEGNGHLFVARIGRETENARRGQVRPAQQSRRSPMKREGSLESPQTREGLAVAAGSPSHAAGG